MKKHSHTKIKELLKQYPKVADVLDEFNLPCKTCSDNDCLTKDIAEIENFSLKDEVKFIKMMSNAISRKDS